MAHALRLFLIAAIVALSIVEWIGFPWRLPLVALLALVLVRLQFGTLAPVGLAWPVRWRATLAWAVGLALVTVAVSAALEPLFEYATGVEVDYSGYGALRNNAPLVLALLGGA